MILLLTTLVGSLWGQTSVTVKVTHKPSNTIVDGKSVFVLPNWKEVLTDRGGNPDCFKFLEVRTYAKADYEHEIIHKIEITNNANVPVEVTCSRWGFGSGGRTTIKPGETSNGGGSFKSDNGYPAFTLSDAKFVFSDEQQKQYGVSYNSRNIECGENLRIYLEKVASGDKATGEDEVAEEQKEDPGAADMPGAGVKGTYLFFAVRGPDNNLYVSNLLYEQGVACKGGSDWEWCSEAERRLRPQVARFRRQIAGLLATDTQITLLDNMEIEWQGVSEIGWMNENLNITDVAFRKELWQEIYNDFLISMADGGGEVRQVNL
jgi:hypothetical protein